VVGENTDAGAPGLLKITVDGGDTWTDLLLPEIMFPGEVVFANSQVGYIGGTHHDWSHFRLKVLKTTDGGMTWSTFADMGSDGDMFFGDMMFRDSVTSWIMGDYYAIQIHGGEIHNGFIVRIENLYDWIYNDSWRPRALYFTSPDSGWAVGQSGLFMDTRDNGDHWTIQYLPPGNAMNDITFTDNFHGWAVGNTGTVMYTENNGYTAIAEDPGRQSEDQGLHIFPNPAKDLVEIQFEMSSAGRVNLQLYTISGQRIRQYDAGFFPEGRQSINFSPENLPPGVYFIRLFIGNKTLTGRLTIQM
jgi:hypothetical protein